MNCESHHNKMNHHGCCCQPSMHRHFLSDDEKRKQLESYKKSLETELQGVQKAIEKIQRE